MVIGSPGRCTFGPLSRVGLDTGIAFGVGGFAIVGFIIAAIIVTIGFASIKESSYMLIDACNVECIDIGTSIKQIAELVDGVNYAHIVRLRKTGPVYQGELEIEVSDEMKIKEFNEIKNIIQNKILKVFPEIERVTITAITKKE